MELHVLYSPRLRKGGIWSGTKWLIQLGWEHLLHLKKREELDLSILAQQRLKRL